MSTCVDSDIRREGDGLILAQAWTSFGGASLALMGASLIAGARKLAGDNRAWRREWARATGRADSPSVDDRPLIFIYRAAGALVAGSGFGILSAGRPFTAGPGHPRMVGIAVAAVGAGAAALKFMTRSKNLRFLEGDPLVVDSRPLDQRLSDAASWALCALWIGFGAALLRGSWR